MGKVSRAQWSQPTSWAEVKRRAAGRYQYNAVRTLQAQLRRRDVLKLLGEWGWTYGVQAQIARVLNVHESTISRDLQAIMPLVEECPHCHSLRPREWWSRDWPLSPRQPRRIGSGPGQKSSEKWQKNSDDLCG